MLRQPYRQRAHAAQEQPGGEWIEYSAKQAALSLDHPLHAIRQVFRSGKKRDTPAPAKALVTREERITVLQAQLAKDTADLTTAYRELSARRAALKPGDEKAIADYNSEAARYATLLESTRKARTELDGLMATSN